MAKTTPSPTPVGSRKQLAEAAEIVKPDTITIECRGTTITIPASLDDCSVEVLEAFEDQKAIALLRGLIGDGEYARIKRELSLTVADLRDITDEIGRAYGFTDAGE